MGLGHEDPACSLSDSRAQFPRTGPGVAAQGLLDGAGAAQGPSPRMWD